ncbi:LytTR family transcriptional regulator DNA-binding domain-containing protein [Hymenobacter lutimineralis]|nr:LytTR family transcriptional regulator DNA-binding domain-containing protein [Hymenobacter lutimineralis]
MRVVSDEQRRLDALENQPASEAAPEASLQGLTRLAALICGTPLALVSLLPTEYQWFKNGSDSVYSAATPQSNLFCQQALQNPTTILEVPDASQDPRFKDTDLLLGHANVRFCAGAPLVSPAGQALGTLCTMHTEPHTLTREQREALKLLAQEVTTHLELRKTNLRLEQEKQRLDGLLQLANDAPQALLTAGRDEVFVKHEQRLLRIKLADICYLEALGDYVNIYTWAERLTVYTTMKDMEAKLPAKDFTRIQRKYIIRLACLQAIEGDAVLVDGPKGAVYIPIGNSYKTGLLGRLNII